VLERKFACSVHAPAACPDGPLPAWVVTSINSAELIKHASNSFLAMKISYANMVADLAEKLDADIEEVVHAMGLDPRIGPAFLSAGLGFGGFCFPKDLQAFVHLAGRSGVDFSLLKEVEKINKQRIERFFEKIRASLWVVRGKRLGVLGLAFKPNTDDVRFAPAIELVKHLLAEGALVRAYDPAAMEKARPELPDIDYAASAYEAAEDAEALLITTEWKEFRDLDWSRVRESMSRPLIIDGRNLLSPGKMRALGFEYLSFGRPS
jgi:UDPglucose 6-dehydrogenase